jgi:pyruvate/2-oxoacid:ferredoxin oxidoreductase alpha subunit
MHELLHWSSGARLPIVMVNVNRSMGAPWSLEPDQTDSLSQRDTGWIQIYCADVQEIMDTVILSFYLAEESRIPCMVVYDGFSLSHTYEAVEVPEQEQVDAFLPLPPGEAAINPSNPKNIQAVTDFRYVSRVRQEHQLTMEKVPEAIKKMDIEFNKIFGRSYPLVESVGLDDAETVIVTAGSMGQTVKSVLPSLSSVHSKKGFLRFRLFRPLPEEDIAALLGNTQIKKILVIDRNLSAGAGGIFAQELRALLQGTSFQGEIFQLNLSGGVDLTPGLLNKALEKIEGEEKRRDKIIWGVDL